MAAFTITKHVEAPVDKVFGVFSDIPNAAEHVAGITKIEMLSDGDVGAGTRWRETRVMFKKEATEEMAITEFEPNESYTVECDSCGCHYVSTFRFRSDGDATLVDVDFNTRATSFLAKLMTPLAALMMGPMKKCIDKDLEDLKQIVEARASEPAM